MRSHLELLLDKWPLKKDHLSTTATIFGSQGWSLHTGLTVCIANIFWLSSWSCQSIEWRSQEEAFVWRYNNVDGLKKNVVNSLSNELQRNSTIKIEFQSKELALCNSCKKSWLSLNKEELILWQNRQRNKGVIFQPFSTLNRIKFLF